MTKSVKRYWWVGVLAILGYLVFTQVGGIGYSVVEAGPTQCVFKGDVFNNGEYLCAGLGVEKDASHVWLCKNGGWIHQYECDSAELCMDSGTRNAYCAFSLETNDASPLMSAGSTNAFSGVPV